MAFNPANIANAFIDGRQARQQYDYGQTRNALAEMDLQNAPTEIANRNALTQQGITRGSQTIESGQMGIDQERAKVGYSRLKQALDSGNPKAYVLEREPDLVNMLKQHNVDLASLDDEHAAQIIDGFAREYAGKAGMAPAGQESFTLKPGEARYSGGHVVAERAANADGSDGFTLGKDQRRYDANGKLIAENNVPGSIDPSQKVDIEGKLRNEYTQNSKEFLGVANSYQRIKDSVSDPSPAGDLSLIFNYMKVLDPGSTVREGEFATAQNAGSVGDRVVGLYNRILNGERLAPDQRADFFKRATGLYKGQETRHNKNVRGRYERLAKSYGVDPQNVITDINAEDQQAPAAPQAAPVRITNDAEYAKLPPNAQYIAPDGSTRTKR
jgi:hypothetical protein